MSESSNESRRWAHAHHDFFAHVVTMPGWHKAVLILGAVLTVAGAVGVLAAKSSAGNPSAAVSNSGSGGSSPSGARSMVDSKTAPAAAPQAAPAEEPASA